MASKCSATPSIAASAPCRGASWRERGPLGCRTPTCWRWGESELCPTPGWCTAGTRSATRLWRAAQSSPGSSVSLDQSGGCRLISEIKVCSSGLLFFWSIFVPFGSAGCPSLSLRGRPRKRRGQDDRESPTSNQSESWIERMKVGFRSPDVAESLGSLLLAFVTFLRYNYGFGRFFHGSALTFSPCPALRRTWWAAWRPAARAAGSLTPKSSSSSISSTPSWSGRAPPSTKSLTWASKRVGVTVRTVIGTLSIITINTFIILERRIIKVDVYPFILLSSPVLHSSCSWLSFVLLSLLFCVSKCCLLYVCSRPLPHVFCRETTGRLQKGKAVTSPPNKCIYFLFRGYWGAGHDTRLL